jgi:uroporphyrin-3 C-methyltransferase
VSETTPQVVEQLPEDDAPVTPAPVPARRGGGALAALALLVGLLALAAAGWSGWQVYRQQAHVQQQIGQIDSASELAQAQFRQNEQRIGLRLAGLPTAEELAAQRDLLASLQGDQQRLAQSLSNVLSESRQDWRLAEAEHLLRLAVLRLTALQDVASATALVQGADDILRAQDDPQAFAARGELIKALEALRALPQPDRSGLFLQLGALRDQVEALQTLAPEFQPASEKTPVAATDEWSWARLKDKLSNYLRIDLHADEDVRPLLAGQSLAQVRLTLSLALEQAQWAALNGEPKVYQQALDSARQVLDTYFDRGNPAVQAMLRRFDELAVQPVTVQPPDLSPALGSLQAYLKRREAPTPPQPASDAAAEEGAQ